MEDELEQDEWDENEDEELEPEPEKKPGLMARLFTPPPPAKTPEPKKKMTTEEFVSLSKEDDEFLFGGLDDEDINVPEDDFIGLSEKDKSYLLDTNIDKIMGVEKSKVKYTVSKKKKSRKSTRRETDTSLSESRD